MKQKIQKPDPQNWSDDMHKSQNGDHNAYRKLLSEISIPLKNYLNSRLFNKHIIEDVLQETLLAIHKARHTYDIKQPFEHWMYGIARHKLIDAIRKETRLQKREISSTEFETFLSNPTNNINEEWSKDLEKALNSLPNKQKTIITLAKIEGYSMAEVANKMDMSEAAVKVSAHRAYKKLKTWLVNYGYK